MGVLYQKCANAGKINCIFAFGKVGEDIRF